MNVPPIYAIRYNHQQEFMESNFASVIKNQTEILDEFIACVENDFTRDYMLGRKQFPKEVPPECFVIKYKQFKAASTPSYSQNVEKQVWF